MTALKFPFAITASHGLAVMTQPSEEVGQQILFAITTEVGERVMRPTEGVGITNLLFGDLRDEIIFQTEANRTLAVAVPAATINDIDLHREPNDPGILNLRVTYTYKPTGTTQVQAARLNAQGA